MCKIIYCGFDSIISGFDSATGLVIGLGAASSFVAADSFAIGFLANPADAGARGTGAFRTDLACGAVGAVVVVVLAAI